MTWEQFRAARQVLAEVRVGRHLRADAQRQDDSFDRNLALIRKMQGA